MKTKKGVLIALVVIIILGAAGATWFALRNSQNVPSGEKSANTAAPYIQLNIPQGSLANATTESILQVAVSTNNFGDIDHVDYLIDGQVVSSSSSAPFTVDLKLTGLSPGKHTLQAVAYDRFGRISKSEMFRFTIDERKNVEPADENSEAIIRQSVDFSRLGKGGGGSAVTASSHSSNGGSSGSSNGGGGGDNGDGGDTPGPVTPLTPPAEICGNTSILNGGPTSPPTGATTVPAGSNSGFDFDNSNTTYWFAPGVHTLAAGEFAQIRPSDNATFIGAPGAILDGQDINKYAFTQHGENVTIKYLTIRNFVAPKNEGVVNHDSGEGWTVEYSTIQNNGGGGLFLGRDNSARYNCLKDNGQYGFQVYSNGSGPQNVVLDHNEIVGNNTDDWEAQDPGCGCTGAGKFWDAHAVDITNNYIHDNLGVALWADTNDTDFLIEENYISDNEGQGLFYEISYNMIVRNNNFIRNAQTAGAANASFPSGAIYLSESGGDNRVGGRTANIDIYDNIFTDNWSGVVLWENADRYCASPSNTSTGYCTIVNPAATLATCGDPASGGLVDQQPYLSDCRWKTQNVKVHDNTFAMDKANIPTCNIKNSCGLQGVFSNVGSSPSWSPYKGTGVQEAITFNQNNVFSNNTYTGDWNFMVKAQNKIIHYDVWRLAPYNQDASSTISGNSTNFIDPNTATLEGTIGKWISWYSDTVARTNEQAHTGSYSLKVNITDPFGWGVQLSDTSGYAITPKQKTVSFWGRLGAGTNLSATMQIKWLNAAGSQVGSTESITLSSLNSTWRQASQVVTPPNGAVNANVTIVHSTGTTGNNIYLDDFVIQDIP